MTQWNEFHHLLIMESLGGNASAVDRTLAQTMAFGYYWYVESTRKRRRENSRVLTAIGVKKKT